MFKVFFKLSEKQPVVLSKQPIVFRISECKYAKEMWDTLKATHGNIIESKEIKTRSQARRKRRQNRKSLNLCFMAKKEDDSSSVSSSNSSNT